MFKSYLAAAVLAVTFALGSAGAFAETSYPKANAPVATPISQAHQQAQLGSIPDNCGDVAAKASDSVSLRIQQNSPGGESRQNVNALLLAARNAAAAGNDESCWHWYDRAQQVVR